MGKLKEVFKEKTKSIRMKLFLTLSVMIIAIISFLIFANTFLIEKYYLYSKKDSLLQAYNNINNYLSDNEISTNEIDLVVEKIAITNNFSIIITDENNEKIYYSSRDYRENLLNQNITEKGKVLYSKNKVYILELKDFKNGMTFLTLIGKTNNDNKIYIRMPVASIIENVKISNNFLYIIGLLTLIVGGIIILYISKKFTKPILELSTIANKMSNLDFSQKYRIKDNNDEIDNLGKSINIMSDKLENTIKELQKNNSELEKDIEKKSKMEEMRKQFISDVSHELKTPIALIQGYSEGLIENINTDEENRKFYSEVILDEANKMDNMVKELLELNKLEYGAEIFNNESFDILDLINDEIRKYTVVLKENNIEIKCNIKNSTNVYADQNFIEKVINNYLSNAIKNIEEIDGKKYIEIKEYLLKNNKVKISIFNTGKNISKENLNKIWNRFYKEDSSRNRNKGGTGIGLSIVKAIMENYKNNYGVKNRKNGVEFFFELDIAK